MCVKCEALSRKFNNTLKADKHKAKVIYVIDRQIPVGVQTHYWAQAYSLGRKKLRLLNPHRAHNPVLIVYSRENSAQQKRQELYSRVPSTATDNKGRRLTDSHLPV